jgi:hypothetical protein
MRGGASFPDPVGRSVHAVVNVGGFPRSLSNTASYRYRWYDIVQTPQRRVRKFNEFVISVGTFSGMNEYEQIGFNVNAEIPQMMY